MAPAGEQQQRSWWLWAGAAAGAATIYVATRPRRAAAGDDTDFAGFLNDPADAGAGAGAGAGGRFGGAMALYFGCRRRDQDFLYGADLERWAAAGALELHTAFSREPGRPKVYVQQRLEEGADRVWQLLEAGAHFYICGDANSMAGAVEAALARIVAARLPGGGGEAAGRAYVAQLAEAHRFQRDVWFS